MLHFSTTLLLAAACLLTTTGAERVTTCGGHVHRLSCDTGVISVESAFYGRADTETCAGGKTAEEVANTACSLDAAEEMVKARCDGKKVCETCASVFGADPCSGTFKYVETNYTCIPATHFVTCEHSRAYLSCDNGKVITIRGADFGRRDGTTCAFQRQDFMIQNVKCYQPTSKVAEKCNGRQRCSVRASSSVLGESCANTYKYLEVAYTCEDPVAA
ncbi:L-rhamnose-binding lectin SML-like [Mugil cephalus]|uniref:L-rhamnose-binding lectin SML-like n=1 Tax=Mugil cephalus TaxID=48193 RepID=UPI001FB5F827|nr:L-rhamnose-binding lectin SML-like [Mugil cephalus]